MGWKTRNILAFLTILIPLTTSKPDKLLKVITIFRHGARYPVEIFGMDEEERLKIWPEGYEEGMLSKVGKNGMYEYGQRLLDRYWYLITPHGQLAHDVSAFSTTYARCHQSAALVLAGLYPPDKNQTWNSKLRWQPVPIYMSEADNIHIFSVSELCPRYFKAVWQEAAHFFHASSDMRKFMEAVSDAGIIVSDFKKSYMALDFVYTMKKTNVDLPKWMRSIDVKLIEKLVLNSFDLLLPNADMMKLYGGPFIREIFNQMNKTMRGVRSGKITLFASHDSTVLALTKILGNNPMSAPDFGASVIFELYGGGDVNEYSVRVILSKNHTLSDLETWIVPGCQEYCPFGKLVRLLEHFVPMNWERECHFGHDEL